MWHGKIPDRPSQKPMGFVARSIPDRPSQKAMGFVVEGLSGILPCHIYHSFLRGVIRDLTLPHKYC
jgi:hypothetical protein